MDVKPILQGDLGQRYEVRQRVSTFEWEGTAWSDSPVEAEAIARHVRHDLGVLEVIVVDRGPPQ